MYSSSYYQRLFDRFLKKECTDSEMKELMNYLSKNSSNKMLLSSLQKEYENTKHLQGNITDEQSDRIRKSLLKEIHSQKATPIRIIKRWHYAAAAIIFFIIGSSTWFVATHYHQKRGNKKEIALTNAFDSIQPGTNKASLTLSDGSVVRLFDSASMQAAKRAGMEIFKDQDGQLVYRTIIDSAKPITAKNIYNTIHTPRGGQCKLILPDGSNVLLNAESYIRFPLSFSGNERKVDAAGEIYFDIAKNPQKPFKVITGAQEVEVLGTHFIVNSSKDKSLINTTLLEGSIRLSNGSESQLLKPGQKSKYSSKEGKFIISNLKNVQDPVAWTEGYFSFDNTDFITIQEQLEKWYDVTFEYDKTPENRFYGKIQRSAAIEEVLKMMEIVSKNIHFKIQGRKIYVIQNLP